MAAEGRGRGGRSRHPSGGRAPQAPGSRATAAPPGGRPHPSLHSRSAGARYRDRGTAGVRGRATSPGHRKAMVDGGCLRAGEAPGPRHLAVVERGRMSPWKVIASAVAMTASSCPGSARSRSARQDRLRMPFMVAHRAVAAVWGSIPGAMEPSAMPSLSAAASLAFCSSTRSATRSSAVGSSGGSASRRNWCGRSAAKRA